MPANLSDAVEFPPLPGLPTDAFPEDIRPAIEAHNRALVEWYEKINGFLSLGTADQLTGEGHVHAGHFDGELIRVTVPAANTDFAVPHTLERIPMGFFLLDAESAEPLHRLASSPAHTDRQLWVRTAATVGTRYLILVV